MTSPHDLTTSEQVKLVVRGGCCSVRGSQETGSFTWLEWGGNIPVEGYTSLWMTARQMSLGCVFVSGKPSHPLCCPGSDPRMSQRACIN